ncbi:MAG TPA: MaoC family dehydratase N-terminal domain-containing protein [Nocardioidaceae bacterium]|nr:MaoC family dehydratase N-terminal domain-containing protein [Nocardioidaceae bacterium]
MSAPAHGSHEWIMAEADRIAAAGESAPRLGRDPVNQPMVNNWVEAMGDRNPVYVDAEAAAASEHGGLVAPPAMAQVWTMGGLHATRDPNEPLYATMSMLDEAGYTSVVATDTEQTYLRYLRHGEQVSLTSRLESVVGPKTTALGEGYFVTTRNTWYVQEEPVATMVWRILKFKPAPRTPAAGAEDVVAEQGADERSGAGSRTDTAAVVGPGGRASEASPDGRQGAGPGGGPAAVLRPMVNRDSEFFWEGTRKGELRIQRCGACDRLRHPPGPMCPSCGATQPDYVVARGTGSVFSYVVHRHPPVPGKQLPILLVLVELDEGVRMVGELLGAREEEVEIGMPVEVSMVRVDDDLTLPAWRPVTGDDR